MATQTGYTVTQVKYIRVRDRENEDVKSAIKKDRQRQAGEIGEK
jgi:hypothetical protein